MFGDIIKLACYVVGYSTFEVLLFKLDVLLNGLLSTYLVTAHRRAGSETFISKVRSTGDLEPPFKSDVRFSNV